MPPSPRVLRKTAVQSQVSSSDATESVSVGRSLVQPPPSESSVHGKEVHVATQKQTQKEVHLYHKFRRISIKLFFPQVQGDLEITRKITATETTEMEHKAKTLERVVTGQVVSSFMKINGYLNIFNFM